MMIGALPDLLDTQSGIELIQIGKREGKTERKTEGKIEGLLLIAESKFDSIDTDLRTCMCELKSSEEVDRLLLQVLKLNLPKQLDF